MAVKRSGVNASRLASRNAALPGEEKVRMTLVLAIAAMTISATARRGDENGRRCWQGLASKIRGSGFPEPLLFCAT
jgi:hypothetical protein